MSFKSLYPLTPKAAIYAPLTFRMGLDFLSDVPETSLNGIRDLAGFAAIGDGAIRTALSREKAAGLIISEKDSKGVTRYRMAQRQFDMGRAAIERHNRQGFLLAVFSFTDNAVSERKAVRETLQNYGFRKLSQNTYINGEIETEGLLESMREFGLEESFYLFHCPEIDNPELIRKILTLFNIKTRAEELRNFHTQMKTFLSEAALSDHETARRILYLAPIQYEICQINEFPIPAKYLPENYALQDIQRYYHQFIERHQSQLKEYYQRVNR